MSWHNEYFKEMGWLEDGEMISKAGKESVELLLSMSEEESQKVMEKLTDRQLYILEGLFKEYEAELNEQS